MAETALPGVALPVGAVERRGVGWWGVLTVIATEGALFVYLLFSYYYYDVQFGAGWLPTDLPPLKYGIPNLVILVISNLAAWFALRGVRRGRQLELLAGLGVAFILGLGFVALQALEWAGARFTLRSSTYGSIYYLIGGFHLAHLVAGLLMLLALILWSALGYFDRVRHAPVLIVTAYWNFVLAVFVAVFFTFYVTPRIG
ncbi:MAG TPA: cytochrome c oxidase subunit 3 [Stellaceae bacterium]|jgi:heme/copper-type cytochrome/quinol oxidase subunit 3